MSENPNPTPGGPVDTPPANVDPTPWLSDTMRANDALKGFDSGDKLAQAYLDTLANAPKAPEGPDKYDLGDLPEHLKDDPMVGLYRDAFHKGGLTQEQAKAVFSALAEQDAEQVGKIQAEAKKAQDALASIVTALKKDWGGDFDARSMKARITLQNLGGSDFAGLLQAAGLAQHPVMLRFGDALARVITEDKLDMDKHSFPGGRLQTEDGRSMLRFPSMEK